MAVMLLPYQLVVDALDIRRQLQYGRLESQHTLWLEDYPTGLAHRARAEGQCRLARFTWVAAT